MVINSYTNALLNHWKNTFGDNHVMTRKSIKEKLVKIIKSYYTEVYAKGMLKLTLLFQIFHINI